MQWEQRLLQHSSFQGMLRTEGVWGWIQPQPLISLGFNLDFFGRILEIRDILGLFLLLFPSFHCLPSFYKTIPWFIGNVCSRESLGTDHLFITSLVPEFSIPCRDFSLIPVRIRIRVRLLLLCERFLGVPNDSGQEEQLPWSNSCQEDTCFEPRSPTSKSFPNKPRVSKLSHPDLLHHCSFLDLMRSFPRLSKSLMVSLGAHEGGFTHRNFALLGSCATVIPKDRKLPCH